MRTEIEIKLEIYMYHLMGKKQSLQIKQMFHFIIWQNRFTPKLKSASDQMWNKK